MKKTVPAAFVLTMVFCFISYFAAWASDSHRYHHHRLALVYVPCSVFHFHVIELRHYRVVSSSLRPAISCGWWSSPNPSDLDTSGQANGYNQ
jgi:hypothetical protein